MKKIILVLILICLFAINSYASPTYWLEFDGTNDYVNVPYHSNWDVIASTSSNRTIDFWMYIDSIPTNYSTVLSQHDPSWGADNNSWTFEIDTQPYCGGLSSKINGYSYGYGTGMPLIFGTWYHVAWVKQGTSFSFYVDGVTGAPITQTATITLIRPLEMGRQTMLGVPGGASYFDGRMGEVRFWNIGMTQAQVQYWMNNSPLGTDPNLLAYWDFHEQSGNIAHDLTSYGNNGTIYGAQWGAIPEPSTMFLFGFSLLGAGVLKWRKR